MKLLRYLVWSCILLVLLAALLVWQLRRAYINQRYILETATTELLAGSGTTFEHLAPEAKGWLLSQHWTSMPCRTTRFRWDDALTLKCADEQVLLRYTQGCRTS